MADTQFVRQLMGKLFTGGLRKICNSLKPRLLLNRHRPAFGGPIKTRRAGATSGKQKFYNPCSRNEMFYIGNQTYFMLLSFCFRSVLLRSFFFLSRAQNSIKRFPRDFYMQLDDSEASEAFDISKRTHLLTNLLLLLLQRQLLTPPGKWKAALGSIIESDAFDISY